MDPENTGVVTVDEPGTSQAATQANTLDNVDVEVINALTPQTDVSTGAAPDATTPVPGEPEAAPVAPVEGTEPAEADEAKMHRISQDNANLRTTLRKTGVDPDSDVAEQLRTGLLTYDDIVRSRQPVTPAATEASTQTAPEVSLEQQLANLKSNLDKPVGANGVSSEDYLKTQKAFMDVVATQAQEIDNIKQSQEKKEFAENANKMVSATGEVFNTQVVAELSNEIPEEVRQIGAKMFLGATDIENISLIETHGKEKAVTADGYRHSATQVAPDMKRFVEAIYKAGRDSLNPNPNPAPAVPANPNTPRTTVQALRPGGGPISPPPDDKDKWAIENLGKRTTEHFGGQEGRV